MFDGSASVEAAAPVRFSAPAEVTASVPEVAVWRVRPAEVTVNDEAAPEAMATAPADELPMETAPFELPVLMFVPKFEETFRFVAAPVTVRPAWPVKRPAEVVVPDPLVEIFPDVERLPELSTWSGEPLPTENSADGELVPTPTSPLLRAVSAFVAPELPTFRLMAAFVPVLPEVAELPWSVSVPLALVEPMPSGVVTDVANAGFATVATVTWPEPLLVVVMFVPWAMVAVEPWLIVELEPEVAASVKMLPADTRQVGHVMVPAAESCTGPVAATANVPLWSGRVYVRFAVMAAFWMVAESDAPACGAMAMVAEFAVVEFTLKLPVPFVVRLRPAFASLPATTLMFGFEPFAALASVIELFADVVAVRPRIVLPFASKIDVPMRGVVKVLLVSVWVAPSVATVSDDPGNVNVVPSVPEKASELFTVNVLPAAMFNVFVPLFVIARPFTLVNVGVVETAMVGVAPEIAWMSLPALRSAEMFSNVGVDPACPVKTWFAAPCAVSEMAPALLVSRMPWLVVWPESVAPAKVGLAVVVTSWLMFDVPETVSVFAFSVSVPVPVVMVLPLYVPPATLPTWVMLPCTAAGRVDDIEGAPPDDVTSTPLAAVARPASVFADDEYRIWFAVVVAGYVAVDHDGAAVDPDKSTWFGVAVPDKMAPAEPVE